MYNITVYDRMYDTKIIYNKKYACKRKFLQKDTSTKQNSNQSIRNKSCCIMLIISTQPINRSFKKTIKFF